MWLDGANLVFVREAQQMSDLYSSSFRLGVGVLEW